MTEEKIVERVTREIAREVNATTSDAVFLRHHHCKAAARAVVALLGPAPLVWVGTRARAASTREYTLWRETDSDGDEWFEVKIWPGGDSVHYGKSREAAEAAAEAHHRAAWLAQTVAWRENG